MNGARSTAKNRRKDKYQLFQSFDDHIRKITRAKDFNVYYLSIHPD